MGQKIHIMFMSYISPAEPFAGLERAKEIRMQVEEGTTVEGFLHSIFGDDIMNTSVVALNDRRADGNARLKPEDRLYVFGQAHGG